MAFVFGSVEERLTINIFMRKITSNIIAKVMMAVRLIMIYCGRVSHVRIMVVAIFPGSLV